MAFDSGTAVALPARPGWDHAMFALLPVTAAVQPETPDPLTIAYQLDVDGRTQRVAVELHPGKAGMPVHADQTVYLALLQLALRNDPPAAVLTFRRPEVFELLGWSRGDAYERLHAALTRFWQLGIMVRSALVARDGREYSRSTDAAHLIDSFHIGSGRDATCRVEWGQVVREAFVLGDFKRLDWDLLLALGNPLTMQLYRLLDRVTLSGHQRWEVGWRPLAAALGMRPDAYSRPARFRQVVEPHLAALVQHGVVDSVDYERGGKFVFHVRNYLRAQLRRVLVELGCFEEAARQLVAGFDELVIMHQADCLQHGTRPRPDKPGGYLATAVREGYELRYPEDEPEAFVALWSFLGAEERHLLHEAGLRLCGDRGNLFNASDDPTAWETEFRAVVRFMVCHGLDPEEVLRRPRGGLLAGG